MTLPTPNCAGLSGELASNILPSFVQPAYCTRTASFALGFALPVPLVSTLLASPVFVRAASFGACATSSGAGRTGGGAGGGGAEGISGAALATSALGASGGGVGCGSGLGASFSQLTVTR